MKKKTSEEIYPFGSQHPKVSNVMALSRALDGREIFRELTPKEKALKRSMNIQRKRFGGQEMKPAQVERKVDDKIYSMALIKECKNLSKEEKLDLLEFVLNEKDMKRIIAVIEEYIEPDEGIWERVVEATKRVKSLFYTHPAGKKDLKFAGKKPKSMNRQLSKVVTGENEEINLPSIFSRIRK
jgi:hypothetical protein